MRSLRERQRERVRGREIEREQERQRVAERISSCIYMCIGKNVLYRCIGLGKCCAGWGMARETRVKVVCTFTWPSARLRVITLLFVYRRLSFEPSLRLSLPRLPPFLSLFSRTPFSKPDVFAVPPLILTSRPFQFTRSTLAFPAFRAHRRIGYDRISIFTEISLDLCENTVRSGPDHFPAIFNVCIGKTYEWRRDFGIYRNEWLPTVEK